MKAKDFTRRAVSRIGGRFLTALTLLGLAGGVAAQAPGVGGETGLAGEQLIPAAMGILTDKQGNSWSLEQNGGLSRVGNSMVNSGLTLLINNQQFYTYQPMMTADGSEFVFFNRQNSALPGLQVMRRIRMIDEEGAIRYLEVLSNGTSNPLNLNVSLRTNFSGNYKSYLTDQGNSGVVTLGQRESSILVTPGSGQATRAFIFTLCSPKSALKPAISSQNKYGLNFQYNIALAPGQTVVLAHAVAQVPVPREFGRSALARLFRPASLDRLAGTIPRELRPLVINDRPTAGGEDGFLAGDTVEHLGVEIGRRDVLALGEKTRLIGTASCGKLSIDTGLGVAEIPFDRVAALVGGNRDRRDRSRIFLRDGQVFGGVVTAEDLRFQMASGGRMTLQVASLDRLVRARGESDGKWDPGTAALVGSYAGDRLAVREGGAIRLTGATPWGTLDFTLDDIFWLAPREEEPVGHFAEFKDGSQCLLFLAGDTLSLDSPTLGRCSVNVAQIQSIVTRAALERAESERAKGAAPLLSPSPDTVLSRPLVKLAGGQKLSGAISSSILTVLTHNETVSVSPEEVRRMVNLGEPDAPNTDPNGPAFRLELWGGGVINGYLAENFLQMRVRDREWSIPFRDVRELSTPAPRLGESARQEIVRLMRLLGAEEWQARENATEELKGFGYLAHPILQEELRANPDPEVQRRLERILSSIAE
ncbi:MAG: hypothetical protein KDM91_18370 [Verrucomicrobiae bacterium]|nr:hypothetical protein [Verrucomicrobiae bacterium]